MLCLKYKLERSSTVGESESTEAEMTLFAGQCPANKVFQYQKTSASKHRSSWAADYSHPPLLLLLPGPAPASRVVRSRHGCHPHRRGSSSRPGFPPPPRVPLPHPRRPPHPRLTPARPAAPPAGSRLRLGALPPGASSSARLAPGLRDLGAPAEGSGLCFSEQPSQPGSSLGWRGRTV